MDELFEKVRNNLHAGEIYKNYKELCSVLGENIKNGASKRSQIKEWERYFSYEKKGQKMSITEIYDIPRPKEDDRSTANAIYVPYIQKLILDLLNEQKDNILLIQKWNLMEKLGLINSNFYNKITETSIVKSNDDIDNELIREYRSFASSIIGENLNTALESLSKRFIVSYENEVIIYKKKYFEETEDGEIVETVTDYIELNNVEEKKKYSNAKRLTLSELNSFYNCEKFVTMKDVKFYGKTMKFYSILNRILEDEYGWIEVKKYIRVAAKSEAIEYGLSTIEKNIQIIELNSKIVERMNKATETRYNREFRIAEEKKQKFLDKGSIVPNNFDYTRVEIYYPNKNFIKNYNTLTDKLVKLTFADYCKIKKESDAQDTQNNIEKLKELLENTGWKLPN